MPKTNLRTTDAFRFPLQNYSDEKAIFTNMRYLQDWLRLISQSDLAGDTYIVAASNSEDKLRADAVCDGQNDEEQINFGLNIDPAGSVMMLEGDYTIGSRIDMTKAGNRLIGQGKGTKIKVAAGYDLAAIRMNIGGQSHQTIQDLALDGTGGGSNRIGIQFNGFNAQGNVVDSVRINNFNIGIQIDRGNADDSYIFGCLITNCPGVGIHPEECHVTIADNRIVGCGIGIQPRWSGNRSLIIGNIISFGTTGIDNSFFGSAVNNLHIVNNRIHNNSSHGIVTTASNFWHIVANQIHNNGGFGISAQAAANHFVAVNTLYANTSGPYSAAANLKLVHNHDGVGNVEAEDHGNLSGLADDDHPQYVLRNILTTKGDLFVRDSTAIQRLAVGANGQVLTADSAVALGVKWAPAAAGGGGDETPIVLMLMGG